MVNKDVGLYIFSAFVWRDFFRNRIMEKVNEWVWWFRPTGRRFRSEQNLIDRTERDLVSEHAACHWEVA